MSLAFFTAYYNYPKTSKNPNKDLKEHENRNTSDENTDSELNETNGEYERKNNYITLMNNSGYIKRRKKPCIISRKP